MSNSSLEQDKAIYTADFVSGEGNARELMDKSLTAEEKERIAQHSRYLYESFDQEFAKHILSKVRASH